MVVVWDIEEIEHLGHMGIDLAKPICTAGGQAVTRGGGGRLGQMSSRKR